MDINFRIPPISFKHTGQFLTFFHGGHRNKSVSITKCYVIELQTISTIVSSKDITAVLSRVLVILLACL